MEYKLNSYSNKCNDLINILKLNNQNQLIKWQILNCRNIQNSILNYIGFTPKTKEELKEAVNLWCNNKKEAIKKYGDINTWNVHNITDMSELFWECYDFNDNINNWDVSNVKNMKCMFFGCEDFNQILNNWDVFYTTNISYMFHLCFKLRKYPKWYEY
mgnify:CR=1 FL=1